MTGFDHGTTAPLSGAFGREPDGVVCGADIPQGRHVQRAYRQTPNPYCGTARCIPDTWPTEISRGRG